MNKYLFLYRRPEDSFSYQPSPDEMQAVFKAWQEWKEKFKENIVDMGDGLKAGGKVIGKKGDIVDGPFVEAKEVMGGYSVVHAKDYPHALEVAKACPMAAIPGCTIEVREMAGY